MQKDSGDYADFDIEAIDIIELCLWFITYHMYHVLVMTFHRIE